MKNILTFTLLLLMGFVLGQKLEFQTLLKDRISIRAIQLVDGKVWYAGTDAKFGYVSLKDSTNQKQITVSDDKREFRTLAATKDGFYLINIGSPAHWFSVKKDDFTIKKLSTDTSKSVFYDALVYDQNKERGWAISDPDGKKPKVMMLYKSALKVMNANLPTYVLGEAHFAASNSNIAAKGNSVWIASGGAKARVFKFNWNNPFVWKVYETPFVQGKSSQGIYSIDFYDQRFGVAVGGDYTQQAENVNNIATTHDGGETWQIQASGKNGGYKTCIKIRPRSKGKEMIAVGDQNIEYSSDYGETWTKISDEKGLYTVAWLDENTLVFAGKNRIVKANFEVD